MEDDHLEIRIVNCGNKFVVEQWVMIGENQLFQHPGTNEFASIQLALQFSENAKKKYKIYDPVIKIVE